jgi:hypothetical protein
MAQDLKLGYPRKSPCSCGSGWPKRAMFDARGIFLCYVCVECEKEKRQHYRPEVLTDPNYDADDLGDDAEL